MTTLTNSVWGKQRMGTISASRISSFIRCGIKFRIEYIYGIGAPGGLNMHRGSGVHKAAEMDNKNYMLYGERLPLESLLEYAHDEFNEKVKEGVFIPARDVDKTDKLIDKAIDEMDRSLNLYYQMEKPWIPTSVEEFVTLDLGYPLPVIVRIDMIDSEHCIYDWKSMAKNTQISVSVQDLMYCKYYEITYGVKPKFKYVKFILTKEPKVEVQEIIPPDNYDMLDRYVDAYFNAIENDVFLPASNTDFLCSEGGCPFYLMCEY